MDLRSYNLSQTQLARAAQVLNYQPFWLSDDLQTGVAYSWIGGNDPRVTPPLVFSRGAWEQQWDKITDANRQLANIYDGLIDEVVRRYPGGSFLDVACNNGYFPVAASLRGMHGAGFDMGRHYADSIDFLNAVTGSSAQFTYNAYVPGSMSQPERRYDVVAASAIMCHLPDPLNFLAYLGAHAKEAILFWGQVVDTDALVVAYTQPHPDLSDPRVFPYSFNDNTRISLGLFREAVRQMGFKDLIEIPSREGWLWHNQKPNFELRDELINGSGHTALLAVR